MIIRKLDEIINSDRDVAWGNGQSRRFLLEKDGMGYSMTDTVINAGTESLLELIISSNFLIIMAI